MRLLLAVALLVAGCGDNIDPGPDAQIGRGIVIDSAVVPDGALFGEACELPPYPTIGGCRGEWPRSLGSCIATSELNVDGVCRPWCTSNYEPQCKIGQAIHTDRGACVCVPVP